MSELDRAVLIRLPIDQEVFIETVRDGDTIDDATVATEVVSFDRAGDAYVLEGAIVFAGYMDREQDQEKGHVSFSVGTEDDEYVQHVHHRMPFVLRVPLQAQPRGLINVKSRISSWSLNAVGKGWLRVVAELQISGLQGNRGYHFQCGSQELGNVFFGESEKPTADATSMKTEEGVAANNVVQQPEVIEVQLASAPEDFPEPLMHEDEPRVIPGIDVVRGATEAFSAAREGHSWQETQSAQEHEVVDAQEVQKQHAQSTRSASAELAELDRLFGADTTTHVVPQSDLDTSEAAEVRPQAHSFAQFEFEHQLSADELATPAQTRYDEHEFVASRSFSAKGFQPAAGFATPMRENSAVASARDEAESGSEATDELRLEQVVTGEEDLSQTGIRQNLWSFVDFNAPDRLQTLRFVIVMDEETLESLADRIGCTRSELIRVNKLTVETVTAGQCMLVPAVPFTLTRTRN